MEQERILSLDISTKTGYALLISNADGCFIEEYGMIPKTSEPPGEYPGNYVQWAYQVFGEIMRLIDRLAPDHLVIEETASGSRNIYSQKILEWIHFLVSRMIRDTKFPVTYFLTEQWRRIVGCTMTTEEKKKNKQVRDYKKKNNGTQVAYDIKGKRIGITGRKHINVRRANEIFGDQLKEPLKRKDEDVADGLLLGFSRHLRRVKDNEQ